MPFPLLALAALIGVGAAAAAASSSSSARPVPDRSGGLWLNPIVFGPPKLKRAPPPKGLPLAPSGDPFVLIDGDLALNDLANYGGGGTIVTAPRGYGLDATGQYWAPAPLARQWGDPFQGYGWTKATANAGPTFDEVAAQITTSYVLPAIALAVGTAIGGPGGAAAAFAITALTAIAKGKSLSKAVVESAYSTLSSQLEKTTFAKAYLQLASNPYGQAAVARIRQSYIDASSAAPADTVKAFDNALFLAQSKKIQDLTISRLKERLATDDEKNWLDVCLAAGVTLDKWVSALYGAAGVATLDEVAATAAADVQNGKV